MADFWYAECIPCKWEEKYSTQDSAIAAAEDHVERKHRGVPSHVRGQQKIGHVQNRTENSVSDPTPGTTEAAAESSTHAAALSEGAPELSPAPEKTE